MSKKEKTQLNNNRPQTEETKYPNHKSHKSLENNHHPCRSCQAHQEASEGRIQQACNQGCLCTGLRLHRRGQTRGSRSHQDQGRAHRRHHRSAPEPYTQRRICS